MLDEAECLRLLGHERFGRLGMSVASLPVILPVNYTLDGMTIVFRSEDGAKTRAAEHGAVACLEIDHSDSFEHIGWSVLATGRLGVAEPSMAEYYERLPVVSWALSGPSCFLELSIELLSGRSLRHSGTH